MSDKPLSFKERLQLRAQEATQPETKPAPVEEPKSMQPKRFGFPKATTTQPEVAKDETPAQSPNSSVAPITTADTKPTRKFGSGLPRVDIDLSKQAVAESSTQEDTSTVKEEAGPLPKVIQAYNTVGGQAKPTEGELLSGHGEDEAVKRIREKILDLGQTDSQVELKYEMSKLSEMLIANPAACLYLQDEDLGLAVQALRRMTNNRVAIDMAQAKPTKAAKATSSTKPLTVDEMQSAFDAL